MTRPEQPPSAPAGRWRDLSRLVAWAAAALIGCTLVTHATSGRVTEAGVLPAGGDAVNWGACRALVAEQLIVTAHAKTIVARTAGALDVDRPLAKAAGTVHALALGMSGPLQVAAATYANAVTALRRAALDLASSDGQLRAAADEVRRTERRLSGGCARVSPQ